MMDDDQWTVLLMLRESQDHGMFAVICDGSRRNAANQLHALGLAEWKGHSFGSSWFAITDAGRAAITAEPSHV